MTQIAKRMNEVKQRGQPLPFDDEDLTVIHHLTCQLMDFVDQVWSMTEGRRERLDLKISEEMRRLSKRGI